MLPPLASHEASAAIGVQDICRLLYEDQVAYSEVEYSLTQKLAAFRMRCPVASCRRVLAATRWVDGARRLYCGCGWETRELKLWHGVPR